MKHSIGGTPRAERTICRDSEAQAESEKVYVYEGIFAVDPTVTAIAAENSSGDNANVNLVVSSVSTTSCTISASDEFTGYAHVQIILVMS